MKVNEKEVKETITEITLRGISGEQEHTFKKTNVESFSQVNVDMYGETVVLYKIMLRSEHFKKTYAIYVQEDEFESFVDYMMEDDNVHFEGTIDGERLYTTSYYGHNIL